MLGHWSQVVTIGRSRAHCQLRTWHPAQRFERSPQSRAAKSASRQAVARTRPAANAHRSGAAAAVQARDRRTPKGGEPTEKGRARTSARRTARRRGSEGSVRGRSERPSRLARRLRDSAHPIDAPRTREERSTHPHGRPRQPPPLPSSAAPLAQRAQNPNPEQQLTKKPHCNPPHPQICYPSQPFSPPPRPFRRPGDHTAHAPPHSQHRDHRPRRPRQNHPGGLPPETVRHLRRPREGGRARHGLQRHRA